MKKLSATLALLCALLCGCNAEPITDIQIAYTVSGQDVIIDTPDTMYMGESVYAIATCPVTDAALDDQGQTIFSQSYQKFRFYLDNNQVQQTIEADLQNRLDLFFAEAGNIQNLAREDCFSTDDWIPYSTHIQYTPSRIDERVISFYATHESYNGTGTSQSISGICYDSNTGNALCLGDILDPSCTGAVLAQNITDRLGDIDGLYDDYSVTISDIFSGDISGFSNWYMNTIGLCFLFSPYEISPTPIQVVIPYSALNGLMLDAYLPALPEGSGSLGAEQFQPDIHKERFSFIAELVLNQQGQPVVIYPNNTIANLRIEIGALNSDGTDYTPEATVFAADVLYAGNAVVLTIDQSPDAPVLRVSYRSNGQDVSAWVLRSEDGSLLLAYG